MIAVGMLVVGEDEIHEAKPSIEYLASSVERSDEFMAQQARSLKKVVTR